MANIKFLKDVDITGGLTTTGDTGIGTSSPETKLDTNGVILARGGSWNGGGSESDSNAAIVLEEGYQIYTRDNDTDLRVLIGKVSDVISVGHSGTGYIDSMRFYSGLSADYRWFHGGDEHMRLNSTGLGIGTDSPARNLHVHASSGNAYLQLTQSSTGVTSNDGFQISMGASQVNFINRENGNMIFETNNSEKLRITSGGNVGIGTSSPVAKLDIAGNGTGPSVHDYAYVTNAGARIHGNESALDIVGSDDGNHASSLLLRNSDEGFGFVNCPNIDALQLKSFTTNSDGFSIHGTGDNVDSLVDIMTIEKTGNVGIGTASPSSKLHVLGTIRSTSTILSGSSHNISSDASTGFYTPSSDLIISGGNNTTASADIILRTNDGTGISERMRIDSDGNVGIGTTSPSEKLEVDGTIKVLYTDDSYTRYRGQGVFFNRANSYLAPEVDNFASLNIGYDGAKWGNVEINGAFIKFENGSNERMRIDSSGNVGIGTTSPNEKLDVEGNVKLRGTNNLTIGSTSNGGNFSLSSGIRGFNFANNNGDLVRIDANGNVGIGTTSPVTALDVRGEVSVAYNATYGLRFYNNDRNNWSSIGNNIASGTDANLVFKDATGEVMRITGGNVGIGTTAPTSLLHLASATGPRITLTDTDESIGIDSVIADISFAGTEIGGETARIAAVSETAGGEAGLRFHTGQSVDERLRIDKDGNVGIGTTSPSTTLHIKKDNATGPTITLENDSNETYINNWGSSGPSGRTNRFEINATATNSMALAAQYISLQTGGVGDSNEKVRVTSSGNVGIGTTSPLAKIHVTSGSSGVSTVDSGTSALIESDTTNYLRFVNPDSAVGGLVWTSPSDNFGAFLRWGHSTQLLEMSTANSSDSISFSTGNSTERMRIDSDGNVGVGTTGPISKMHIVETSTISPALYIDTARYGASIIGDGTSNSQYLLNLQSNGGSTDVMRVQSSGNVGIGTTSPKSKLQVAGGIQMADDTDTASADKVGTMRYRTGTEYVEVTGAEILTNPGFDTDTTWVKGTGWTIANGKASVDNAASTALSQPSFGVTTGKIYNVRIDVSNYTSGTLQPQFGGSQVIASISANGEYNYTVTSTITGGIFYLYGVGDCEFSIDNVSVIEVEAENASYADMCMQTGASTYEWVNIIKNTY